MAKRGPKPTPVGVLQIRGSVHAPRKAEEQAHGTPVLLPPNVSAIEPPRWLSAAAKTHWQDIAAVLGDMQITSTCDRIALAMLCDALAQYLNVRNQIYGSKARVGFGLYTTSDRGTRAAHPAVAIMNGAWDRVLKMLREFGMTPQARNRFQGAMHLSDHASSEETQNKTKLFATAGRK